MTETRDDFVPGARGSSEPLLPAEAELARVQVQVAARVADVTRLSELEGSLSSMVDIQEILEDMLRTLRSVLDADAAIIKVYDPAQGRLIDLVRTFANGPIPSGADDTLHRRALERLEPVTAFDLATDRAGEPLMRAGYGAACVVPLLTAADEVMGTLAVYCRERPDAIERERRLMESTARQIAAMVERARLHGEARQLAALERRRAEQLRRLADAAVALNASSSGDVLRVVTESAMAVIGTHQGVTSHLVHGWSEASTHVSLSDKYAAYRSFDEVPKGRGVLNYVTRENKPLRLTGDELARHPEWRGLRDAPAHPPIPNYLAAPLIARDGRNLGLIQLADKIDGTDFTAEDEAMLVQLAQMASVVIENVVLFDRERQARAEAEERARLRERLSDASKAFASSLERGQIIDILCSFIVPALGDWAAVHDADERGAIELTKVSAAEPSVLPLLDRVLRRFRLGARVADGREAAGSSGRSRLFTDITDDVLARMATDDVPLDDLRSLGVKSAVLVPIGAEDATVAWLTIARATERGRPAFTEAELEFVEDLAQRAGLALATATMFASERQVAETLQRSLLPDVQASLGPLRVSARYIPGASGSEIGGDWYDVLQLEDGRVAFVVGDVMGRGIPAAAIMGQVRAAFRAYALEGHAPSELLRRLDRVVQRLGPDELTTCVYGVLDPSSGDLRIASAGHVPPVLIDRDRASYLDLPTDPPLGSGCDHYREHRTELAPGSVVLLYTDGLVEGRECPIDDGMRMLIESATGHSLSVEDLCDHVLRALGGREGHDDDVALLAVALPLPVLPDGERRSISLEPDALSAGAARRFVREQVHALGAPHVDEIATLLVSETVTNAIVHAASDMELSVERRGERIRISVRDRSRVLPEPHDANPGEDEWGRGLLLIEAMADEWGFEPDATGKQVWFELDATREADT